MPSFPNQLKMETISSSNVSLSIKTLVHQHTCGSARDASCQVHKTSSFMNSNRTLKLKSLPIRRLNIALPCCQYRVTAAISVAVVLGALVIVVMSATVAVIPVVVDADVAGVADVGVGVGVAVDVWADDARHYCCCKVPGAGASKADVDGSLMLLTSINVKQTEFQTINSCHTECTGSSLGYQSPASISKMRPTPSVNHKCASNGSTLPTRSRGTVIWVNVFALSACCPNTDLKQLLMSVLFVTVSEFNLSLECVGSIKETTAF